MMITALLFAAFWQSPTDDICTRTLSATSLRGAHPNDFEFMLKLVVRIGQLHEESSSPSSSSENALKFEKHKEFCLDEVAFNKLHQVARSNITALSAIESKGVVRSRNASAKTKSDDLKLYSLLEIERQSLLAKAQSDLASALDVESYRRLASWYENKFRQSITRKVLTQ